MSTFHNSNESSNLNSKIVPKTSRPKPVNLFCSYSDHSCIRDRLPDFQFCSQHILENPCAPFRPCSFVSHCGKRCNNPAPSESRDGVCTVHAEPRFKQRQKILRKLKSKETVQTLLGELDQYVSKNKKTQQEKRFGYNLATKALECVTSSDSESEELPMEKVWMEDVDSDSESDDSTLNDPRSHAGVFTAEEVAQITGEKLTKLQSLYIEQFKQLKHQLNERRSDYLKSIAEYECSPKGRDALLNASTIQEAEKAKAIKRYHRQYGEEAVLNLQAKERRREVSVGETYQPPAYPKCAHINNSTRCSERVIPLSKYCRTHILFDHHQVLFVQCECEVEDCGEPVAAPLVDSPRCPMHMELQPISERLPSRQSSEENREESEDMVVVVDDIDPIVAPTCTLALTIPAPPSTLCTQDQQALDSEDDHVTEGISEEAFLTEDGDRETVEVESRVQEDHCVIEHCTNEGMASVVRVGAQDEPMCRPGYGEKPREDDSDSRTESIGSTDSLCTRDADIMGDGYGNEVGNDQLVK